MEDQEGRSDISSTENSQEESVMPSADTGRVAQESLRGQEPTNKWAVMIIVAIGVFMATLDSSIVQ